MSAKNENAYIEKYKGNFNDVDGGCTVLHTKAIQSLTNPVNLAIYTYLASKPPEWEINIKELMSHFRIGKNKTYKAINDLILIGLITRVEIRSKGQFLDYAYYLHLSPIPKNRETVSPIPQKPVPGLPVPENRETYKEEKFCIKRKERKKSDFLKPQTPKPTQAEINERNSFISGGYEVPHRLKWVDDYLKHQTT